jgi:hypothetical protein
VKRQKELYLGTNRRSTMRILSEQTREYLRIALFVLVLTPALYLLFRNYILAYGLIWMVMLSIGLLSRKYPQIRLYQFGLFMALLMAMFVGFILKNL